MSNQVALETLTQLVFVAVFVVTLAAFVRRPTRDRGEVVLLFGCLAFIIVLGGLAQLTGKQWPLASLIGALLLLAQPYLLLRLVAHFRDLSRLQHGIGLTYLAFGWVGFIVTHSQPPAPLTLAIVVGFAYVEGYSAFAFVQAAVHARGVTKRRLIAIAVASGILAAVILVAGVGAFVHIGAPMQIVDDVLGLVCALCYYAGFAPPAWLRRIWQQAEFQKYLAGTRGHSAEDRFDGVLDRLGLSASAAVGASAAVVALNDGATGQLRLHLDPATAGQLDQSNLQSVQVDE
ncbi:MAG: hypothetical protein JOZ39_07070, partial [Chloroflexi bacterium]|nr:hypothetical protein [Chloroflexota bacterium]